MPKKSHDSVRHDAVPAREVHQELTRWTKDVKKRRPEIVRIGYFGSYARGDYVPSSDVDVFIEVAHSPLGHWAERGETFPDAQSLPVGAELFVYTTAEIAQMENAGSAWLQTVLKEMVWVGAVD